MKRTKLILLIFLTLPFWSYGQSKLKPVRVGDTVPEVVFDMLNMSDTKVSLSNYRGKLLIIDCWNIYCGPCIKAMPELALLQNKFKEKMQIIALECGTAKNKVIQFLKQKELENKKIELPVGHIKDPKVVFYELFPRLKYGFPVEIWIDSKGVLVGITESFLVNENMINTVLSGNTKGLRLDHYQADFKKNKPLLVRNNGGPDSAFIYRSMITPYIDSIASRDSYSVTKTEKSTRLFFANKTIAELVKLAVYRNPSSDYGDKLLELDVTDSKRYLRPRSKADLFYNLSELAFCYEVILPPDRSIDDAFSFMLEDLQRYFKIKISTKQKNVKCLVVEKLKNGPDKSIKGESVYKNEDSEKSSNLILKHNNHRLVTSFLNKHNYPYVVDQVKIDYPIDINLSIPVEYDFKTLKEAINKSGLDVTERMLSQNILVISEFQ